MKEPHKALLELAQSELKKAVEDAQTYKCKYVAHARAAAVKIILTELEAANQRIEELSK